MDAGAKTPTFAECVGYHTQFFLGGADTLSNLEVIEMNVYWHMMAELRRANRGLPTGTRIAGVDIV